MMMLRKDASDKNGGRGGCMRLQILDRENSLCLRGGQGPPVACKGECIFTSCNHWQASYALQYSTVQCNIERLAFH